MLLKLLLLLALNVARYYSPPSVRARRDTIAHLGHGFGAYCEISVDGEMVRRQRVGKASVPLHGGAVSIAEYVVYAKEWLDRPARRRWRIRPAILCMVECIIPRR